MRFKTFLMLAAACILPLRAETSASKIMREAFAQASKENKVVFLDFGSPG
jgi:hypothetical protein